MMPGGSRTLCTICMISQHVFPGVHIILKNTTKRETQRAQHIFENMKKITKYIHKISTSADLLIMIRSCVTHGSMCANRQQFHQNYSYLADNRSPREHPLDGSAASWCSYGGAAFATETSRGLLPRLRRVGVGRGKSSRWGFTLCPLNARPKLRLPLVHHNTPQD